MWDKDGPLIERPAPYPLGSPGSRTLKGAWAGRCRMRLPILALALASLTVLAGCVDPSAPGAAVEPAAGSASVSYLEGAVEPEGLEAPAFDLVGAIARGGPVYGAGEPSVAVAPDGAIYAAFPGCDEGLGPMLFLGLGSCASGVVYRSGDRGRSWMRLNDEQGNLAKDAPSANGDADVAVDSAGNVYVTNLGEGIESVRSLDGGATWTYTGNVVPKGSRSVDRNWLAAAGPGHVIHNWMGGPSDKGRKVGIVATFDGGESYADVTYVGESIGWQGSVQFAPNGTTAYVPFTELLEGDLLFGGTFELMVARTLDGGRNWTVHPTGVVVATGQTSFHFSGLLMAPNLDVTSDGTLVWAYSEESQDPAGLSATKATVKLIASRDLGETWSEPLVVSQRHNAIFPWAAGGAGDRVAVAYLASDVPADPDRAGVWDLVVAVVDGVGTDAATVVETVVDANVHQGGVCASGGGCFIKASDRALLDYLEMDVMPDGQLVIAYPADPLTGGKAIEVRVAVQSGGSPLFLPRPSA